MLAFVKFAGFTSSPTVEQLEIRVAMSRVALPSASQEPLLHCLGNHAQNDKQFSELDATCQGVQARRWLPRSGGDVGRAIPGIPPRSSKAPSFWEILERFKVS